MVALGEETAGLFSNNDKLANALIARGKETREEFWRMPITNEHREGIKRDHSDLNNCGKSRYADASSAAAFLERFLEKDKEGKIPEWAHMDIAGTCITKDGTCTGFGTQTLLSHILTN